MGAFIKIIISLFLVCTFNVGSRASNKLTYRSLGLLTEKIRPNSTYIIDDTLNLHGKIWYLPEGICFKLIGKGLFFNGTIVGNKTRIEGKGSFFSNIHIQGSWCVPKIRSSMFSNLDYDNSLRDILALTNPDIHNDVIIEKGNYYIALNKNAEVGLLVESNTKLTINGQIVLRPNSLTNYSIITTTGDNISIKGHGCVCGDRYKHKGKDGEWGRCLTITGTNITVAGIRLKDAWGDCVYVTGKANEVLINNCLIENGRRQGISIISSTNVRVKNCQIFNIGGTDPEYAIDVEPNQNDTVSNTVIENVKVENCVGGFSANGRASNSKIKNIKVKNCSFTATGKPVVIGTTIEKVQISNCYIKQSHGEKVIAFDNVKELTITGNTFVYESNALTYLWGRIKDYVIDSWPMIISHCDIFKFEKNSGL